MTILGISVGTTNTGVCVLHDDVLRDRAIHSYHVPEWSEAKLRKIVSRYRRYVTDNRVTAIIVKVPLLKKQNEAIALLLQSIEQLAEEHGCTHATITKREIRETLKIISAGGIVEVARMYFPELARTYQKGLRTGHSYYKKIYEAVLSAHIMNERLKGR